MSLAQEQYISNAGKSWLKLSNQLINGPGDGQALEGPPVKDHLPVPKQDKGHFLNTIVS